MFRCLFRKIVLHSAYHLKSLSQLYLFIFVKLSEFFSGFLFFSYRSLCAFISRVNFSIIFFLLFFAKKKNKKSKMANRKKIITEQMQSQSVKGDIFFLYLYDFVYDAYKFRITYFTLKKYIISHK